MNIINLREIKSNITTPVVTNKKEKREKVSAKGKQLPAEVAVNAVKPTEKTNAKSTTLGMDPELMVIIQNPPVENVGRTHETLPMETILSKHIEAQ